jgi:hypothetical protein
MSISCLVDEVFIVGAHEAPGGSLLEPLAMRIVLDRVVRQVDEHDACAEKPKLLHVVLRSG